MRHISVSPASKLTHLNLFLCNQLMLNVCSVTDCCFDCVGLPARHRNLPDSQSTGPSSAVGGSNQKAQQQFNSFGRGCILTQGVLQWTNAAGLGLEGTKNRELLSCYLQLKSGAVEGGLGGAGENAGGRKARGTKTTLWLSQCSWPWPVLPG